MKVVVNGKEHEFQENITLQEALELLQIADKVMAAAINMEIVKKEKWSSQILQEGDKLELLDFVGGG